MIDASSYQCQIDRKAMNEVVSSMARHINKLELGER